MVRASGGGAGRLGLPTMTDDRLVTMANQIATFFSTHPDDEAVAGMADHIRLFWDSRMRDQFLAYLSTGGEGLSLLARKAGELLLAS
jgi:formate dehydrogenase subunit delta